MLLHQSIMAFFIGLLQIHARQLAATRQKFLQLRQSGLFRNEDKMKSDRRYPSVRKTEVNERLPQQASHPNALSNHGQ